MADAFAGHNPSLVSAGVRLETITPHDTNTFDPTRGIMVNASGLVVLKLQGDSATHSVYLLAGVVHPLRVILVTTATAAGVTSAGILAVY